MGPPDVEGKLYELHHSVPDPSGPRVSLLPPYPLIQPIVVVHKHPEGGHGILVGRITIMEGTVKPNPHQFPEWEQFYMTRR